MNASSKSQRYRGPLFAFDLDAIAAGELSPLDIDRISYEESKVFVNVTKEAILEAPQYHVSPLGESYGDTRNFD